MSAEKYFSKAIETLSQLARTQKNALDAAAGMMVEAIVSERSLYSFGASHSFILTEEMVYRTGGLMLMNPIYPHGMNLFIRPITVTSRLERVPGLGRELLLSVPIRENDVLLIASVSGRNAVVIDMALQAREMRVKTIGITSSAYSGGVASRHPSGKKLSELCDLVIDNGAPYGDAAVEIPGFAQKVGPLSSVTGCALVNALTAEVVDRLVRKGIQPPVFMSANLDGGDEYNQRLLEANRRRIHYLG
ncbi:MAG: SIS domain-containing protein [Verrucomicrobiae bacterium]|nr:SIS domain-containing protein [Verrucomicrobiae bacterium]